MVDELKVIHRVGGVRIGINSDNRINEEIVKIIMDQYQNIYYIGVYDNTKAVDGIHNQIK